MKKYSLCLTNYNRYEMLIESFAKVIDDERIEEIIISDDASDQKIQNQLVEYFYDKSKKIKLRLHDENVGMLRNKEKVMSYAKNDWILLWDSDNIFDKSYLDAADDLEFDEKRLYAPDFAMPSFDYRPFNGNLYNKHNIKELFKYPMGVCIGNTCNYLINKKHYPFDETLDDIKAADSIYMLYKMLKVGYSIYVVPNMQYIHRQHPQSGFLENLEHNLAKAEEIKQLILNLQ